VEDQGGLY